MNTLQRFSNNDGRKVVRYETATFLERLVYLFTKELEE